MGRTTGRRGCGVPPRRGGEATGAQLADADRALNQPHLDAARSRLGDATWEELLAEGRSMTLERAMAYALEGITVRDPPAWPRSAASVLTTPDPEVFGTRVRAANPRPLLPLDAKHGPKHRRGNRRGIGLGDLLSSFACSRWWVGAQPQGDVCWLHRLPHNPHEVASQCLQVRLVAQLRREPFCSVFLAVLEATVYERLDASPQGLNRAAISSVEATTARVDRSPVSAHKDPLQQYDDAEVEGDQRGGESTVDEGAVDEEVYVVEAVAQNCYPHRDRHAYETDLHKGVSGPFEPWCA